MYGVTTSKRYRLLCTNNLSWHVFQHAKSLISCATSINHHDKPSWIDKTFYFLNPINAFRKRTKVENNFQEEVAKDMLFISLRSKVGLFIVFIREKNNKNCILSKNSTQSDQANNEKCNWFAFCKPQFKATRSQHAAI